MNEEKRQQYMLDPDASFYDNVLLVFRMKMAEEKREFEYINPHMMQEVIHILETYGNRDVGDDIDSWVMDMFGA